uniref:Siderophore biosynthesis non-ribosomal peptide synthetase modules @ Bacillibactin synthetase component F n=1 Tax=Rheinheimera sp. BAL341 TaxID=1708203 RepID=A0A486XMP8_9GAMM
MDHSNLTIQEKKELLKRRLHEKILKQENVPLSFSQRRFWFLHQYEQKSAMFNLPMIFRIKGELNRQLVEKSLEILVGRHQQLRARFQKVNGKPIQIISPKNVVNIDFINISQELVGDDSAVPHAQQIEAKLNELLKAEQLKPFELEDSLLFRITLFCVNEQDHVLVINMHHMISDSPSLTLIYREFVQVYKNLVLKRDSQLQPLNKQYSDFASWQIRNMESGKWKHQIDFWRNTLAGLPATISLQPDKMLDKEKLDLGASIEFLVPKHVATQLKEIGLRNGCTPFMVFIASFFILISRFTGEEDIPIGTPVSNRTNLDFEGIVGPIINSVVFRSKVDASLTFEQYLSTIKSMSLEALQNKDVPFEKVVDALQVERSLDNTPLFQIFFAFHKHQAQLITQVNQSISGISIEELPKERPISQFDITLQMIDMGDEKLPAVFEYKSGKYSEVIIHNLIHHFQVLLEHICTNSNAKLSQLQMLSQQDKERLLLSWNDTQKTYPQRPCIHQLISEQARVHPNKTALIANSFALDSSEKVALSYEQLERRANDIAYTLINKGVKQGELVGLCVARHEFLVPSILGILKAGAAYLPLDPAYPDLKLQQITDGAQLKNLLTQNSLRQQFEQSVESIITIDECQLAPDRFLSVPVSNDAPVYTIYTSGSTGNPKGVQIRHDSLENLLWSMNEILGFSNGERLLAMTTISFDISVMELLLPLLRGATTIIADEKERADPDSLMKLIECYQVTFMQATPSTWKMLLHSGWKGKSDLKVLCGGEELTTKLASDLLPLCKSLTNGYGPTEASIYSVVRQVTFDDSEGISIPIGRPIANTKLYILDQYLNPVPTGVKGELYISGICLAKGYYKAPEVTESRFVSNPFEPGVRMYRTGDLASYQEDGVVQYHGRTDFQVKLNGYRIELSEIESTMLKHECVTEAVAMVKTYEGADKSDQLIAYLLTDSSAIDIESLRLWLAERLPDFMVPSAFVVLDEMPLTDNGKIDRKSLPEPGHDSRAFQEYQPPETELENVLCEIWQDVLNFSPIGVNDNFFAIGGDSIISIQVVTRAKSQGIHFPTRALFECQTVKKLATRLSSSTAKDNVKPQKKKAKSVELTDEIEKWRTTVPNVKTVYETTTTQRGMLYHSDLETSAYLSQFSLLIEGPLNTRALTTAWLDVVNRHDALRTSFVQNNEHQIVVKNISLPLEILDWSQTPEHALDARLEKFLMNDKVRGFNVAKPPLLRLSLIKINDHKHRMIWSYHHALIDGWSGSIVFAEVMEIYHATVAGNTKPPKPEARQYVEYLNWLFAQDMEEAKVFWKDNLAKLQSQTKLWIDSLPMPDLKPGHNTILRELPHQELAALTRFAQSNCVTLNIILQAAWSLLLQRYSGEQVVAFGETVSGRPAHLDNVESIVGLFLNTLPVVVDVDVTQPVTELVSRLHADSVTRSEQAYLPFNDIKKLSRLGSNSQLIESLLVFENHPVFHQVDKLNEGAGFTLSESYLETQTNFPLTLVVEASGTLKLYLSYNTLRYNEAAVEKLLDHLCVVLHQMLEHPGKPVGELEVVSVLERQAIFHWNDTGVDFEQLLQAQTGQKISFIHQLFEYHVTESPENSAVIVGDDWGSLNTLGVDQLNYLEFNRITNQLANYLIERGVRSGVMVGVCLERSFEMVISLMAILKAGGAYVPLDPEYPESRLGYMVEDAQLHLVLTQDYFVGKLSNAGFSNQNHVVNFNHDLKLSEYPTTNPTAEHQGLTPESPAYVIYTSGSTGKPKGVVSLHKGLLNRINWMQKQYKMKPDDRVLQKTPFSFDVSVWEFFWPLRVGAGLVIAKPNGHKDPDYLRQIIQHHGVSILHFVPSMLGSMLLKHKVSAMSTVRYAFCSGEQLPAALVKRFLEQEPESRLINLYGPTEASIDVSYWNCASIRNDNIVPIGRPISNTQLYVLNQQLKMCPVGVAGELHIGGVGLASCYLNKPELSRDRFINNPFFGDTHQKLYKTGDLVRWLPDSDGNPGELEFLGRLDHQVKIRGFRIELGEIETCLLSSNFVEMAVVIAKAAGASSSQQLLAYITLTPEPKIDALSHNLIINELKAHVAKQLPDYMVPAHVVVLEEMPLTTSGKIDKKLLLQHNVNLTSSEDLEGPQNQIQAQLLSIFGSILELENVGINSKFFDIGGDSLSAVKFASEINQQFSTRIGVADVFANPTVELLSELVTSQGDIAEAELGKMPQGASAQLSFAQQRLWLVNQITPDQSHYNMPMVIYLKGSIDYDALQYAFTKVIERHEVLRTRLCRTPCGDALQLVMPDFDFAISRLDLKHIDQSLVADELAKYKRIEACKVFDIESDLMVRARLVELPEQQFALLITIHHIASDGWSQGVLIKDFSEYYQARLSGREAKLSPLQVQYVDYAYWQRQLLQGSRLDDLLSFWKDYLNNLPHSHNLPLDYKRPLDQSFFGDNYKHSVSVQVLDGLQTIAREHDATLFMVLHAAFAILLGRHSNATDIVMGTPVANREHAALSPMVGFFVNSLVLRADLTGNPRFDTFLDNCKSNLLKCYRHQKLPFEKLVEALQPERSFSYSPLFQIMLVLQNNKVGQLDLPGSEIQKIENPAVSAKYDLNLHAFESENGLELDWEYATSLFKPKTIAMMAERFTVLLESIVSNPTKNIFDLPLQTQQEKQQLAQWSTADTTAHSISAPDSTLCIHELFEQCVADNPDAAALAYFSVAQDLDSVESITYSQLNERSNQLAHYLRKHNIGKGDLVGLYLQRSPLSVVAILAILKAGAAYVPLDPENPHARLQVIVEKSGLDCIVTETAFSDKPFLSHWSSDIPPIWIDNCAELNTLPVTNISRQITQASTDSIASVIYTSGSTGIPKGVARKHHSLVNRVTWMHQRFPFEDDEQLCHITSFGFVRAVWELFTPLCSGQKVLLVARENVVDVRSLSNILAKYGITRLVTAPSAMNSIVTDDYHHQTLLSHLRYWFVSGEALNATLAEKTQQLLPHVRLCNLYGSTETESDVLFYELAKHESFATSVPIGKPISNNRVYILDKQLQRVPIGVEGEICIAGQNLASGYHNAAELTNKVFVTDPFQNDGSVMFKTGDIGRFTHDGNIEYLGRNDDQVKVRGMRIEIGDIQTALLKNPKVNSAFVHLSKDDSDHQDNRLLAYVQLNKEFQGDLIDTVLPGTEKEIREYLAAELPAFMLPSAIVVLEQIPLSPNGKVDRKKLPVPNKYAVSQDDYVAPVNDTEKVLCEIWQSLLRMSKVGTTDNFFELGGHSLLAVRLISQISYQLNTDLTVKEVFRAQTIAEQSEIIHRNIALQKISLATPEEDIETWEI